MIVNFLINSHQAFFFYNKSGTKQEHEQEILSDFIFACMNDKGWKRKT